MAKKFQKPGAIILDIEGTTTDANFVSKTLFPFIRQKLDKYLNENYESTEAKEVIQRLRESSTQDNEMPKIANSNESKDAVIKSVKTNILWQMSKKRNSSELKQFQILVWVWGYDKNFFKGHVFDDVPIAMHNWKQLGIKLCIFSSGIVAAQQLFFSYSTKGNLLPLIDNFFDNSIGVKTEPESYKTIAGNIGVVSKNILFITDNPTEAKAAMSAGCRAAVIKRPAFKYSSIETENIPIIMSFLDIKF
jgi:enolase-phosphatase E1